MTLKNLRIVEAIGTNIGYMFQDGNLLSRSGQSHGEEGDQDDGEFHVEGVVDR